MANWKLFLVDSFPQFLLSVLVFGYGFQLKDFTYFKANPLQQWEILGIYSVVFFFIFKNVLPKFVSFGGARRHYNDVKSVEKKGLRKFMSKNYIRLFMHILSGATQVLLSGAYVIAPAYFNTIFSFSFLKNWFIFWDLIHETTGFLMTRNHDGIFAIRAFNLAFMVVKLLFCGQIYHMDSINDDFITLVGGIFILTSGFAWVRFTCSIIAIAQCTFYNIDMTLLRENWYSFGLWVGQYAIAWRCQVLGHMHLVFFFCAIYFPIELWIKSRAHFYYENMFATSFLAAAYFIPTYNHEIQLCLGLVFLVYTSYFSGLYWKRAPIPGVDFSENASKEETKNYNLRRSCSYRGVLPPMVSNFISGKKAKVAAKYQKTYDNFISKRSQSRAPLPIPASTPDVAGPSKHTQSVADIITQCSDVMSPEELAAEIVRQLTQDGALKRMKSKRIGHPMADDYDQDDFPALTPGAFFVSRTLSKNLLSKTPSTRGHFHY